MIDLHCHSLASDGTIAPEALPALASSVGLTAVALTDHDTMSGLHAFLAASHLFPQLSCIPGIELSGTLASGEQCHLVGLYLSPDNDCLNAVCRQVVVWRLQRNRAMVDKLSSLGMALDYDALQAAYPGTVIGRPHLAEALVRKGFFKDSQTAFEKCLGRGKAAYVPRQVTDTRTCIQAIHAAGGVAIWAHPFSNTSRSQNKFQSMLQEMVRQGLDGVEAYYPEHSQSQQACVLRTAAKGGLVVSGGSDFHGDHHPLIHLGTGYGTLNVPDALLQALEARSRRYPNAAS